MKLTNSYEVEWVTYPHGAETSMAFGTLEGAESFYYDVELNDGCWKCLSIERIDEHGNYHPEKAIGLVYESKE